jgi:hypothetical protein
MLFASKVCLTLAAIRPLLVGILYIKERRFLRGHIAILGSAWEDVPERHQFLLRSFEQAIGIALVVAGVSTLMLAYSPLSGAGPWAVWTAALIGLAVLLPATHVGVLARRRWGIPIPWQLSLVFAVLYVSAVGFEVAG